MARLAIPQPADFHRLVYRTQYNSGTACIICGQAVNIYRRIHYYVLISNDFQRTPNGDELITADEPDADGGQRWPIHRACAERSDIAPFVTIEQPATDEDRWEIEVRVDDGQWEPPGNDNRCDSEDEAYSLIESLKELGKEWNTDDDDSQVEYRVLDLNEVE